MGLPRRTVSVGRYPCPKQGRYGVYPGDILALWRGGGDFRIAASLRREDSGRHVADISVLPVSRIETTVLDGRKNAVKWSGQRCLCRRDCHLFVINMSFYGHLEMLHSQLLTATLKSRRDKY